MGHSKDRKKYHKNEKKVDQGQDLKKGKVDKMGGVGTGKYVDEEPEKGRIGLSI